MSYLEFTVLLYLIISYSVVFGEAGEAPPIFAQAANSNLVYIAKGSDF